MKNLTNFFFIKIYCEKNINLSQKLYKKICQSADDSIVMQTIDFGKKRRKKTNVKYRTSELLKESKFENYNKNNHELIRAAL